jgi:quinol monooxygenase YgiN
MSVIMTLRTKGDPAKMEDFAQQHQEALQSVLENAKRHGVIAHRFYAGDGEMMVADEWPDPESFQAFFEESREEIEPMMAAVGASGEPEVTFWRKLDTGDEVGWDA